MSDQQLALEKLHLAAEELYEAGRIYWKLRDGKNQIQVNAMHRELCEFIMDLELHKKEGLLNQILEEVKEVLP